MARWPHLFPIWPCALRPLPRVVARVGACAIHSVPVRLPPNTPSPLLDSQQEGSLFCACAPPPPCGLLCSQGARPLPSNPDWEGIFCPFFDLLYLGLFGAPPLTPCPASSPFIRCHGHDQRLEGREEQGRGRPLASGLQKGGSWAVSIGAPPRVCAHCGKGAHSALLGGLLDTGPPST